MAALAAPRAEGYTLSPHRLSAADVRAAIEHMATEGWCLLKGLIPKHIAAELAEEMLRQHEAEGSAEGFALIFGCMSRDDRSWQYLTCHPDPVAVCQHFLGPDIVAGEAVCSRMQPGAPLGGLHRDCAQDFFVVPEPHCLWGVNGIWMLTDFTEENARAPSPTPPLHRTADAAPVSAGSDPRCPSQPRHGRRAGCGRVGLTPRRRGQGARALRPRRGRGRRHVPLVRALPRPPHSRSCVWRRKRSV